jgi:hypothetical protein
MWANFEGKPYTREEFAAHVAGLSFDAWKPQFVTLHNTGSPTLQQWRDGGTTPAQRIMNLQRYYEVNEHWHAGPHLFIDQEHIWGFTDLTVPGVHASCFNRVSIGIEMVGDYGSEAFDPQVRDNAVFALAALHDKLGIRPDGLVYGKSGLHFHVDCRRDGHACPGKHVDRSDMVARVLVAMRLGAPAAPSPPATPRARVKPPIPGGVLCKGMSGPEVARLQAVLDFFGASVDVDDGFGWKTEDALRAFQKRSGLTPDGIYGAATRQAMEAA